MGNIKERTNYHLTRYSGRNCINRTWYISVISELKNCLIFNPFNKVMTENDVYKCSGFLCKTAHRKKIPAQYCLNSTCFHLVFVLSYKPQLEYTVCAINKRNVVLLRFIQSILSYLWHDDVLIMTVFYMVS